jgi:signal transduction histidine kinase
MLLSVTGAPITSPGGEIVGAVAVARDVAERRELERRTQAALNALLAMGRALVTSDPADAESTDVADDTLHAESADAEARGATQAGNSESTPPLPPTSHVARQLAGLTCDVLGCTRAIITAVEGEDQVSRPIAIVGMPADQEQAWMDELRATAKPLSENPDQASIARLHAGEVLVFDLSEPPYRDLPNPYNVRTMLIAPLHVEDRLTGFLALDHTGEHHHFAPEEVALAEAVAQLIALVLERDRLLGERAEAHARLLALRQANQRMNEFLGIVSHELRTPLTSILTNTQLALRQIAQLTAEPRPAVPAAQATLGKLEGLLTRTDRQTHRLARLVFDLLDLSRIQAGKLELRQAPSDLSATVREVVDEQRATQPTRTIRLDLAPGGGAPVLADAERIGQVVTNFLTNALKYSAEEEPVTVRLAREGDRIRCAVSDCGPGVPPEEHEHIWDLFHRVPGIEVRSGSGVGLGIGLHISKTLIERHGGMVGVESAPGRGSTFWFTLPILPAE